MNHVYRWKDNGDEVVELQNALLTLGYNLPKYGADGDLGSESWRAVEKYAGVDQYPTGHPLPVETTNSILEDAKAASEPTTEVPKPEGYIRIQGDPKDVKRIRSWKSITGIVIHQTGCDMRNTPDRFEKLDAHFAVLKGHETPIVQVQEITAYMYHANEFNRFTVGIEINGHWPGRKRTYNPDKHTADGPDEQQIEDTKKLITWICAEVAAHGGKVTHVYVHRQSNNNRISDPGEVCWKALGPWCAERGLEDGGPNFTIGDGNPIPTDWVDDPAYAKNKYWA